MAGSLAMPATRTAPEGRLPPSEVLGVARALRGQLRNWYRVVPVSWIIMRCPPGRFLSDTPLARSSITLHLRNGSSIRCRVNEFQAFVEVFARRDYDLPGLPWEQMQTIIDVGANIGMATLWFAQRAPRARIVAVEPGPAALETLTKNVSRSRLGERVVVLPVALGDSRGTASFLQLDSSLASQVRPADKTRSGQTQVTVLTLRDVWERCGRGHIDLLKLDCEGAEYGILESADDEILAYVDAIVGEYHLLNGHQPIELEQRLTRAGFQFRCSPHPRDLTIGAFSAQRLR